MPGIPTKVSESVRRLNPHLYPVGGLQNSQPESDRGELAVGTPQAQGGRKGVAVNRGARSKNGPILRITLVAYRRSGRTLDQTNLTGGLKQIEDAISQWLGIDDGPETIDWQHRQVHTKGREGIGVTIERIGT